VLVEAVVARLGEIVGGEAQVVAIPHVEEGMYFQLPALLRREPVTP
jgi:hypothetical protein